MLTYGSSHYRTKLSAKFKANTLKTVRKSSKQYVWAQGTVHILLLTKLSEVKHIFTLKRSELKEKVSPGTNFFISFQASRSHSFPPSSGMLRRKKKETIVCTLVFCPIRLRFHIALQRIFLAFLFLKVAILHPIKQLSLKIRVP